MWKAALVPLRNALVEWQLMSGGDPRPVFRAERVHDMFRSHLDEMCAFWLSIASRPVNDHRYQPGAYEFELGGRGWGINVVAVVSPFDITPTTSMHRSRILTGDGIIWTPALGWAHHLTLLRIMGAGSTFRGLLRRALANVGRVRDQRRLDAARKWLKGSPAVAEGGEVCGASEGGSPRDAAPPAGARIHERDRIVKRRVQSGICRDQQAALDSQQAGAV